MMMLYSSSQVLILFNKLLSTDVTSFSWLISFTLKIRNYNDCNTQFQMQMSCSTSLIYNCMGDNLEWCENWREWRIISCGFENPCRVVCNKIDSGGNTFSCMNLPCMQLHFAVTFDSLETRRYKQGQPMRREWFDHSAYVFLWWMKGRLIRIKCLQFWLFKERKLDPLLQSGLSPWPICM